MPFDWQITRGIPELCREVAIALDALLIHLDVAALAFHRRHEEAQRIGAVFVDQAERIDDIALGLGHLRPVRRADETVKIETWPGHLACQVKCIPCIIIRASQKNRMSKPEISRSLG